MARVARRREEPGGGAQLLGRDAGDLGRRLGGVAGVRDEGEVVVGVLAARAHELLVVQSLGDDDVGHRVDEGDVGARQHREVVRGLDVRAADEVDAARVGHDEPGPLAQPPLHPRGEDRVRVGRVGADQQDHVGLVDRLEVLGAGGGAEGLLEAVARGGVAHPRAGVDVVVAERRPDHLLDDVDLLVGAPARRDAADRAHAVLVLEGLESGGDLLDRLLPRDRAPLVVDRVADHRARAGGPCGRRSRRRTGPSRSCGPRWRRRSSMGIIRTTLASSPSPWTSARKEQPTPQ